MKEDGRLKRSSPVTEILAACPSQIIPNIIYDQAAVRKCKGYALLVNFLMKGKASFRRILTGFSLTIAFS